MDRPIQQEQLNSAKNKTLIKATIWLAIIVLAIMGLRSLIAPSVNRADIRLSKVTRGTIEASLSAGGTVVPKYEEVVTSEITGQVVEVIARPGRAVQAGEVILKLDTNNVDIALDSLNERIAVKENQILSKTLQTRKAINDTKARIELLSVDLQSRETRYQRLKLLASSGATAKHELLEAELDVQRTEIEIRQLKTALKDMDESTAAEIEGIKLEKSILEKDQKEKLRLLASAEVKAPRSGILTWVQEEEGTRVNPGEPIARVADLTQFRIEASISDYYADQLREGMPVSVRQSENRLKGFVQTILPTIDNGIVKLLIELEEPNAAGLRANLRVDADIITGVIQDTLMVKQGPFINGAGIHEVFVMRDGEAQRRKVEFGLSDAFHYQIINGVQEGDELIISNMNDYLATERLSVN